MLFACRQEGGYTHTRHSDVPSTDLGRHRFLQFVLKGKRLEYDHARCLRILRLVCLAPAAVFFSYPMGEPLYLLLAALSLYILTLRLM